MATESASESTDQSTTLQELIQDTSHTEGPRIGEFTSLAMAVQQQRHANGVSDTTLITRSTGLWTLMTMDPDIRAVVERGGVKLPDLSRALSLQTAPVPMIGRAELHDGFERAMRNYLADRPVQPPIDLVDICAALMRDGRDQPGGLLPERLNDLDFATVLPVVDRFPPGSGEEAVGAKKAPLSETMQWVAEQLAASASSADSKTTSFAIAGLIAGRHPEYAGDRLRTVSIDVPPTAVHLPWTMWEDDVAGLYDADVLARSAHEVLDGRLFMIGLALVDQDLRAALVDKGIWMPLLLEVDEKAAPAGSALWSVLQQIQFEYGYRSDQATGVDTLGIQGEVNAVCAVITDRAVRPPLAVGLFGKWGTGKSFFMEKMREQIERLTGPSADGGTKPLTVIQIRFNAWHYSDASLWSSLAIEIFERLVDPEPVDEVARTEWLRDQGDPKKAERKELLEKLETYRGAKATLDAELGHLEAEREKLADQRKQASEDRQKAVQDVKLTDVLGELAKDPKVKAALTDIAGKLGLEPAVTELSGLAGELRTTTGYLPAVWRLIRHKTWTVTLAATFFVLALATLALVTRSGWASLGSLATAAGSVGAVFVAASKLIRPAARQVNEGLAMVESAIGKAAAAEAKLRADRDRQERELELTLAEKDHEIAQATQAIAALDEKIAATQATAESLTVGRRLYDFLADRAAGYQKHQGVVGMLHRDFRLLDAQLLAYQHQATPMPGWPAADRVILYIDDLDRCPPAKVLEVLEAVHLLLALELFVVVVGVDPRWLQRSLRHQYRDLVTSEDPRTDPYLRGMPIEYLEKIFQIPLTLPAMEPTGYARLIASLAPTTAASEPSSVETATPTTTRRASSNESPGGDRAPTRALLEVQPGSAASGQVGQRIDLTPAEVEFAQQLGPLVDSPRAAKRLMNTYRLIRATRHVGSRSRFLGVDGQPGEYQAVLTLLAVAAGYPSMADRLLVALQDDASKHNLRQWPSFVAALQPAVAPNPPGLLMPTDLVNPPAGEERGEPAVWANMYEALRACLAHNQLSELEPYQRWGQIVARFSFTL